MLVPALALYALASRRGPAAGAWVAALSLGLVVALTCRGVRARGGSGGEARSASNARTTARVAPAEPRRRAGDRSRLSGARAGGRRRLVVAGLRLAWARFERGAAAPAARCRPWGTGLAILALAGSAAGSSGC